MSFIASVKQFLGLGGVKVVLAVPGQADKSKQQIEGTVTLTSKSDQHVLSVSVKLMESYSTGRGEQKTTEEFQLGLLNLPAPFDMKAGEVKELPFVLPYVMLKSNNDKLKDHGGALGALGKMGAFASGEKSTYTVHALADVKGVALDPSDKKQVRLV